MTGDFEQRREAARFGRWVEGARLRPVPPKPELMRLLRLWYGLPSGPLKTLVLDVNKFCYPLFNREAPPADIARLADLIARLCDAIEAQQADEAARLAAEACHVAGQLSAEPEPGRRGAPTGPRDPKDEQFAEDYAERIARGEDEGDIWKDLLPQISGSTDARKKRRITDLARHRHLIK